MENNNDQRWTEDRLKSLGSDPQSSWKPNASRGWERLQQERGAAVRQRRRLALASVAIVSVGLFALAFPTTRAFAQRCVDVCLEESSQLQDSLISLHNRFFRMVHAYLRRPASVQAVSLRKTAPDFTLQDASGKSVRLSDYRGEVVLLNFWATWCAPCKAEIPWFVEFQQTHRDLNVLGVSFDEGGWKTVRPYMEAQGINYPVMIGNEQVSSAYGGLGSLPTTLIIDREGRIAVAHIGLTGKLDYEAEIRNLLAE